jgi:hypothetical protein
MEENLAGVSAAAAKEYIVGFIGTLKLTEKEIAFLETEAAKWKERSVLARSRGMNDLFAEAEKETEKITARLAGLLEEKRKLEKNIAVIRKQLPGLAARERSIDPDLLEQELLMAAGYLPGDEEKARNEQLFAAMKKETDADAALEMLKVKRKDTSR